jgi:formate dehydrogenase alpha subunit
MMDAAVEGKLKAMYVFGEDPVMTDPDANHIKKAFEAMDFVVVQEIFMSQTAKYADVILPGATFAEKDGTFTNSERRVQRVRKAIEPIADTKPDWKILCEVSNRMGYPMQYTHPTQIFNEIASLTPSYGGINYERIDVTGLQWPCPTLDHPGTPILHTQSFSRGKGLFKAIDHTPPAEMPDEDYPYLLSTGRILYHYNVTTRYSSALDTHRPEEAAMVHPADARVLGIVTGDTVQVTSRRGSIQTKVNVTDKVQSGMIWMSFHYHESPTNELTVNAFDPVSKTGEYKVAAVKIEKAATA